MRTLNLGILAHVDAGKTTLTERLLYDAGAIPELGRVDTGTTQTDSLALERQRGITIRAAVVAFTVGDLTLNLIDTPGHPDFIAEVERSLTVLDGAVLVISAVEGVQAQTVVLMRALRRLRVPTLLFVNKIDRSGADPQRVLDTVRDRLTADAFPLGRARDLGRPDAGYVPDDPADPAVARRWVEVLAEHDEALLAAYVDDRAAGWDQDRLTAVLAAQTAAGLAYPFVCGSAVTGAGAAELTTAIATLLPAATGDDDAPASGSVFKVDRGPGGDRRAWVRMMAGTVGIRDRVTLGSADREVAATITGLRVVAPGGPVERGSVGAGRIAVLAGLHDVRVGDWIGTASRRRVDVGFAPPTLETTVVARDPAQQGALHLALTQLAEQDPLIDVRQDDDHHELHVSLFGAVQQEVIEQTLAADFGIAVNFHATTVLCVERPATRAAAVRRLGEPGNPYTATIGLTVEPGPVASGPGGTGNVVRVTAALLDRPLYVYQTTDAFDAAVTGYVDTALRRGPAGWPVHDCVVTVTESGYSAPGTRSRDVRKLTELVVADALGRAGTVVCEPVDRFELEGPADAMTAVLALLTRYGATLETPSLTGAWFTVGGELPAAEVQAVQQRLSGRTHGEGVLQVEFARYAPIRDSR